MQYSLTDKQVELLRRMASGESMSKALAETGLSDIYEPRDVRSLLYSPAAHQYVRRIGGDMTAILAAARKED